MKRCVAAMAAVTLASAGSLTSKATYDPKSVQDAWDNHHTAVGASDVDQTMWDYVEASTVTVFKWTVKDGKEETTQTSHSGLTEIRAFFTDLYASMPTGSCNSVGGPAPVVSESPGQVFLIWWNPCDGYVNGTDTFTFDENFKVFRQNIVMIMDDWPLTSTTDETVLRKLSFEDTDTSWANRSAGFQLKDVDRVMESYDENAVVLRWDGSTLSTLDTQAKIRQMYVDLFATWSSSDLARIEFANYQYAWGSTNPRDSVFALWDHRSDGYFEGTDTAIFSSNNLIKHHNMVIWKASAQGTGASVIGLLAALLASRFCW